MNTVSLYESRQTCKNLSSGGDIKNMLKYECILEDYYNCAYLDTSSEDVMFALEADQPSNPNSEGANAINTGNPNLSASTKTSGTGTKLSPNTTLNNKVDKGEDAPRILQMIQKVIEAIKQLLKKAGLKLSNRLKHMMVTDKGFKEKLRERERTVQPLKAVRITSYQYLDQYINSFTARLNKVVSDCFKELITCSNPKNPTPPKMDLLRNSVDKVVPAIISFTTNNQEIQDVSALFALLQKNYRGEKKETLFQQGQLPLLIKMAEDYEQISQQLQRSLKTVESFVNTMNSNSNAIRTVPNITDEQRRDFLTNLNKGHRIFNAYQSILQYIYELRVEKALNYRIIVQKFYQF